MMYLVYLAMLALNVSSDVLNAFAVIDEGLGNTRSTIEQTNTSILGDFDNESKINPKKAAKWYGIAKQVNEEANKIVEFIHTNKLAILELAREDLAEVVHDGEIIGKNIKSKSSTEPSAFIMVGDNNDKAGSELKKMINEYEKFLLSNNVLGEGYSEELKGNITSSLATEPGKEHGGASVPWESSLFEHLPMSGVLSIMTGLQINIRNAESEVLKYLYTKIDEGTFKFTNLDATVIPNSSYIIKGNRYSAEVFIAASDTTRKPVVYVTENSRPYDSIIEPGGNVVYSLRKDLSYKKIEADLRTGKAVYNVDGTSLGPKNWGGLIEVVGPSGNKITRPFKRSYMVAEGAVTVAPTKMNVFYIGVDNPVDVSVAGVQPENVSVGITNGRIRKRRGSSYVVNPRRAGNSYVSVSATIDGKKRSMGRKEFRVKRVPDPIAKVAGIKSGGIRKELLVAQIGVEAALENFDFDLKFRVTQFTVAATVQGFRKDATSKNYKFNDAQRSIIRNLSKGQRLYIEDIKAVGPDGSTRSLPAIALLLN